MGFPGQNPMQYQTRFPGQHPIPGQNSIQYGMVHPQNPQWTQPQRPNTSHTPQNYQIKKKIDEVHKEVQEEQRNQRQRFRNEKMEAMIVTKLYSCAYIHTHIHIHCTYRKERTSVLSL